MTSSRVYGTTSFGLRFLGFWMPAAGVVLDPLAHLAELEELPQDLDFLEPCHA